MALVIALGACGAGGTTSVDNAPAAWTTSPDGGKGRDGEPDDPSTLTPPAQGVPEAEWQPAPNFRAFVRASDAAIVGRVTAIGAPRWNTRDDRDPGPATGLRFRDATVAVDAVIYDSPKLPVVKGQQVTVRLYGDGMDTGAEVTGAGPITRYNKISGPVAVGDEVLWVLGVVKFGWNDETTEDTVKLLTDFFGSWRVDRAADRAVNAEPLRSAPFNALVHRLQTARADASNPAADGARGRINPLE